MQKMDSRFWRLHVLTLLKEKNIPADAADVEV